MKALRKQLVPLVAALCLAVGGFGWWQFIDAQSSDAANNHAVVDEKLTATVQSEVAQALEQVLSFDYADPASTEAAADKLLTGQARKEYDTLFAALEKQAPGQKLVLTAQVQSVGVKELSDNKAKVLVFLDQSSHRAREDEGSVSAAQVAVTAVKSGTKGWAITELKTL